VQATTAPNGEPAYLVWPAEAFEWNTVETRRELEELRAAPFWEAE
jgi:hypothetical protein